MNQLTWVDFSILAIFYLFVPAIYRSNGSSFLLTPFFSGKNIQSFAHSAQSKIVPFAVRRITFSQWFSPFLGSFTQLLVQINDSINSSCDQAKTNNKNNQVQKSINQLTCLRLRQVSSWWTFLEHHGGHVHFLKEPRENFYKFLRSFKVNLRVFLKKIVIQKLMEKRTLFNFWRGLPIQPSSGSYWVECHEDVTMVSAPKPRPIKLNGAPPVPSKVVSLSHGVVYFWKGWNTPYPSGYGKGQAFSKIDIKVTGGQ